VQNLACSGRRLQLYGAKILDELSTLVRVRIWVHQQELSVFAEHMRTSGVDEDVIAEVITPLRDAVPHELADVGAVVQDACPVLAIAVDRSRNPALRNSLAFAALS
jgi:hypothetical protein